MMPPICNKTCRRRQAVIAVLLAVGLTTPTYVASREDNAPERRARISPSAKPAQPKHPVQPAPPVWPIPPVRPAPPPSPPRYTSPHWQFDGRYHHNRYYPARGYIVGHLPGGHISITYRGIRYYHHAGVWFRARGSRYVAIAPPFGIVIPFLPFGYSTLWIGARPYYYADDVYYVRSSEGYQVVEPPPSDEISVQEIAPPSTEVPPSVPPAPFVSSPPVNTQPPAPAARPLFAYPKNGQTQTQTSFDRIECDRWAIAQTGFDPSQSAGDEDKHANFQRAATACLEGRGYSVK